jgi:hypothetical protein
LISEEIGQYKQPYTDNQEGYGDGYRKLAVNESQYTPA